MGEIDNVGEFEVTWLRGVAVPVEIDIGIDHIGAVTGRHRVGERCHPRRVGNGRTGRRRVEVDHGAVDSLPELVLNGDGDRREASEQSADLGLTQDGCGDNR